MPEPGFVFCENQAKPDPAFGREAVPRSSASESIEIEPVGLTEQASYSGSARAAWLR
jgi:hypothetical protein